MGEGEFMKWAMLVIMSACIASVNGGYVDGMSYKDGFTATILFMCYAAWCFK